jgi:hypothetical protein
LSSVLRFTRFPLPCSIGRLVVRARHLLSGLTAALEIKPPANLDRES